jgi:hypothetical protein
VGLFKRRPKLLSASELDLRRAFADPVYFAAQVVGFPLHNYQCDVLQALMDYATVCLVGGRGIGKTYLAMLLAIWACIREPGAIVVYVAVRQGMSEYAATVARNIIDQSRIPLGTSIKSASEDRLLFANSSRIHFLPNSAKAVRGFHAQSPVR